MIGTVTTGLVTALIVGVISYLYMKLRRPRGYPPGPPAVPIFGSFPFLNIDTSPGAVDQAVQMIDNFKTLKEKYGPVFSIALGHSWIVVISDPALMKEAFVTMGTDIAGRPDPGSFNKSYNPYAPIRSIADGTYDEQWKKQRHAVIQVLRNLGYGRNITEECIHEEADIMIEAFKAKDQKPFDISDHISNAVANIIISLLFGERYDYSDKEFQKFRHSIDTGFAAMQKAGDYSYIPFHQLSPTFRKEMKEVIESYKILNGFLFKKISENAFDESIEQPRNFIEGYRIERKKNPALENRLFQALSDFVQAGLETTTTTLGWAIYYMMAYPDVQAKVQKELDDVVGKARKPKLSDRANLPFTMATIQEILRLGSTVPTSIPHETLRTCQVGGYTLPKGTEVWGDLWGVMRCEKVWKDPLVFKPERFIDEEGKLKHHDAFVSFGLGRRACLGEQLARQELFIFFSNLVHSFTFSSPDGRVEPVTKGIIALTHRAPPFSVIATLRD